MIKQSDSLEFLKTIGEYENDIIYSDPPYALGSEIIIRADGMVDYKKANDFMNKWEMPTGDYWNAWFKEAYRTLKHGGYCIMFGMDRQLLLFKYYANLAGFTEQQSLYWYFISNFPKATDLSKQIDKNAGAERNRIKVQEAAKDSVYGDYNGEIDDNNAITDLAKKYNGYKYSIAPLKQTNETVMVFQKPYKTGSALHDTLAYENGDDTCGCFALDIDGNRVGTETLPAQKRGASQTTEFQSGGFTEEREGRYPSQTFCNSNTAEVLDKQSGISKGSDTPRKRNGISPLFGMPNDNTPEYADKGGCSKILHKCDFQDDEHEELLQLYQKYAIMKEKHKGDELWENVNTVETPLKTNERELGSVQNDVLLNKQQKIEIKNLQNCLSVFNADWNSWIMKQTEQEKIISVLNDVLHNLDLEKINQNVLYAVKSVINIPIPTALKVAKMLITGTKESMANDQNLILKNEAEYMEDLITNKVDFAIPMLSVLFATIKPEIDTTLIMNFLKKYIMFVKVAIQKYIEETSSYHYLTQYQQNNYDIYFYKSKVSKSERNAGLDGFEDLEFKSDVPVPQRAERPFNSIKNNHPTLKPISLNEKILKLFKTPNDQKICFPFAGSGSEIIGGIKAGFNNWTGCELNQEYIDIANARIEYWTNKFDEESKKNIQQKLDL